MKLKGCVKLLELICNTHIHWLNILNWIWWYSFIRKHSIAHSVILWKHLHKHKPYLLVGIISNVISCQIFISLKITNILLCHLRAHLYLKAHPILIHIMVKRLNYFSIAYQYLNVNPISPKYVLAKLKIFHNAHICGPLMIVVYIGSMLTMGTYI